MYIKAHQVITGRATTKAFKDPAGSHMPPMLPFM
ncbi:hypothetical protein [Sporisorium scitamineum]|uniref:Uncharacterized protein n=1 Tax=Sporisorium scitamineum TaxID=49012 RepID=A0A0F7S4N2_9BASI|nr:hypothetical protein [Sporisorium scitamineum]